MIAGPKNGDSPAQGSGVPVHSEISTNAPPRTARPRGGIFAAVSCSLLLILAGLGCGTEAPFSSDPILAPYLVDGEAAWNPVDSLLVFTYWAQTVAELQRGASQIWIYDLRADTVAFFTAGSTPTWSRDGRSIVFVNNGNIYVQGMSSSTPFQVTSIGQCADPAYCPTSDVIAFDTNYSDPTGSRVIWTINADGTGLHDISVHGTGEWMQPRWSPGGDSLVYVRWLAGVSGSEIFKMAANGGGAIRLTNNSAEDVEPAWSTTGLIAWTSVPVGVWRMTALGQQQMMILPGASMPAWSPDGRSIVVSAPSAENARFLRLWIARSDGTGARELAHP